MKRDSSTESWNGLGSEWFDLAQTGESRMRFIMPFTLEKLGDVNGKTILDLGAGEGGYSRELAKRGAYVTAVDCMRSGIEYAARRAEEEGLTIRHLVRNSCQLSGVEDGSFDIVLCSMMLMDCEDMENTVREAARVLRRGGMLFASVLHPCFDGNHETGIGRQGHGGGRQAVVMNYFEPKTWEAPLYRGSTPVVWRHRTLEEYVSAFVQCGLVIANVYEPRATDEMAAQSAELEFLRRIPLFLFWDVRKPGAI